jgi:hypothetical protein
LVFAQGAPPPPDRLSATQMQNATVVKDGLPSSRGPGQGLVYRLASCDPTNSEGPCFFTISGRGGDVIGSSRVRGLSSSMPNKASSFNTTTVCIVNLYNGVGILGARLKQNVNVTFWVTNDHTPLTLNWGDMSGTSTYIAYWTWQNLSGPTPNPSYGTYVGSTGTAYAVSQAQSVYAPPAPLSGWSVVYAVHLTMNSSGWTCS